MYLAVFVGPSTVFPIFPSRVLAGKHVTRVYGVFLQKPNTAMFCRVSNPLMFGRRVCSSSSWPVASGVRARPARGALPCSPSNEHGEAPRARCSCSCNGKEQGQGRLNE